MSRTIKFAKAGGPEVLEFIDMEIPVPGPHEVRIKVKAIGINRADSMWRNDKYVESPIFPAGLGYDAAGLVDAVGKDVTDFAVGDTVSTIPAFSLNKYSTYGEVILAPDHAVVKHPESLSFVEAASVWMMFLTAYGALVFDAQVKAGDFVIIPAASSSVGLAALQIANYAGATPIALTRTSQKKTRLQEAGAAHAGRARWTTSPRALRVARSSPSSIAYSSSTIWWRCTAIWRTAANSERSWLLFELMLNPPSTATPSRFRAR